MKTKYGFNIIMLALVLLVTLVTGEDTSFFNGFIQGLRKSTTSKSNCLGSIEATEYAADVFSQSWVSKTSSISGRIHNFQSVVNLFTNAATVCKIQSLTDNMLLVFQSLQKYVNGQYDGYAIYLTTKLPDINNYWNKMQASDQPYDKGYYFGMVFALVFRYNI